jgi:hypothetical protein
MILGILSRMMLVRNIYLDKKKSLIKNVFASPSVPRVTNSACYQANKSILP